MEQYFPAVKGIEEYINILSEPIKAKTLQIFIEDLNLLYQVFSIRQPQL